MVSSLESFYCKYLTAGRSDKNWQIYCTSSGIARTPPGGEYPPHPEAHPERYGAFTWKQGRTLDEFALLYITRGRGKFKSGEKETRIDSGTMFMLFPGVKHWYSPDDDSGWDEYWVCFDGDYPRILVEKGFFSPSQAVFPVGHNDTILQDYIDILELTERGTDVFQPKLGAIIIDILALLLEKSHDQETASGRAQIVDKAKFLFEEHLFRSIDMKDFAAGLAIEYATFRRIFKDHTGLSPYQYYLGLKIQKAKELLEEGVYSIKEIAYKLSFENQYYFSRIFKSKTGYSPTGWQAKRHISLS